MLQSFDFGFEVDDAAPKGLGSGFDLGEGEAWGDVLGAVPVVCGDVEDHRPFVLGFVVGHGEALDQLNVVGSVDDLRLGKYLEPRLDSVIHQEEGGFVVFEEVADGDILEIAAKVSVTERFLVQTFKKPAWPPRNCRYGWPSSFTVAR